MACVVAAVLATVACGADTDVTVDRVDPIGTTVPEPPDGGDAPAQTVPGPPVTLPTTPPTTGDGPASTDPATTVPNTTPGTDPVGDTGDGIGDTLWPDLGNPGIDVVDYELAIEYDPDLDRLAGTIRLTIDPTEDRDMFTLDSDGPVVVSVLVDDEPAAFTEDAPELRITPATPLRAADDEVVVTVSYTASPDPSNSLAGIPNGWFDTDGGSYVLNQPDGARSWMPANDHPSDKATWTFRITVPDPLTGVANGGLVERTPTGDGRTTWVWREEQPMPTYLVQLMTGDYEIIDAEGPGGLPLVSVVLRQDLERMQPYLDSIDDQIRFFEPLFGPYPLDRYGIAMTDSFGGLAMETLGRSLFSRDDFGGQVGFVQDLLLSHELAHQWFGDAVSPARWQDIWLNESFATYGEWLWTADVGYAPVDVRAADALRQRRTGFGSPTGTPAVEDMFSFNSYDGGAVVLHALRGTIGDERFFELLQRWVAENTGTSRTTDDFIALAEEVSGTDLGAFFNDWLYAEVPPAAFPTAG